ncbi:TniB family NTP-binding protein [Ruminococcus sp. RTP21484sp1]|uniref:TniB family NTP-binding protein n=1 Tax=Ruminococcus sp. RTP21484sp1 TaxID=3151395 RepID=UPI0032195707
MYEMVKCMPQMLSGQELMEQMAEYPLYPADIRERGSAERLVALTDIYDLYIPSQMSVEIYHKLYMGILRSLQKKESMQAVCQQYENRKGIRGKRCQGIIGGADSFTILGQSGIGKSSAVFRAIGLITEKEVLEMERPYCRIAPCIVVQCPFDSSVKGLLLEILRRVDEVLDSHYYTQAVRARATTDMLIGSVSQVALNHIGLLVVDEIQNVANSRNGKSLVGMLTQLINNSGISICMVGTPESIPFFEQALQLARRSLGLQYGTMEFGKGFCEVCRRIFTYQYTKEGMELTETVLEWLYEHCGGNLSILVSIFHDAQETAILEGRDILDMEALERAYKTRMAMLHEYLEPYGDKKKACPVKRKRPVIPGKAAGEGPAGTKGATLAELVKRTKAEGLDIVEVLKEHLPVEEVAV